jgi:hypothetical protein
VFRVLRPGGELRLLEHVRAPNAPLAVTQDLLTPLWCSVTGGCRLNRETHALVRTAGFQVVRRVVRLGGVGEEIVAVKPA